MSSLAVGILLLTTISVFALSPEPLTFWSFQDDVNTTRVSSGLFAYALNDGDPAHPIDRASIGVFGPYSANFTAASPSQRLRAARADVPALTSELAGPNATVSLVAWVRRPANATAEPYSHGFLAGVWGDDASETRQYAMYFDLGACYSAPAYSHGFAAHVSNCGGPTPGHEYCVTAACDARALAPEAWHCVAHVYDGAAIHAFVNASEVPNGSFEPFLYPGGIFSPESAGRQGAEFGVGVSPVFGVNQYVGLLGGLAVFSQPLTATEVAEVCAWPSRQEL